ncbi:MAG: glycosyltransferase family 4 protein [Phycisphaerae bacterium]
MLQIAIPIVSVSVGAAISLLGTWAVRRWSASHGFVDRPGGHKGHASPVALGGGIPLLLAVVLPMLGGAIAAWLIASDVPAWIPAGLAAHLGGVVAKTSAVIWISVAAALICGLGLFDDARPMGAGTKLVGQVVVAALVVVGCDLRLMSHLGWLPSAALSILWIVTLTNSLNFLDNMDGLAAGVAAIAAAVFAVAAMMAGQVFVPACCWLLFGALAGFLPFNIHPASIYLGDAGSLLVGMLLAVFTILTTFANPVLGQRPIGVVAPLVVMAVPLYDTASVIFLRLCTGARIWTGDQRHFSHRLLRRGMGVRQAVLVIWLATLATALPALLLPKADWLIASVVVLQTLLIIALVALLEKTDWNDKAGVQ